jgi:lysozyme
MDIDLLMSDLLIEEGWRDSIYDDQTRRVIVSGVIVEGVATVGCGLTGPFTKDELMPITKSRALTAWATLQKAIPWVNDLPEPQQRALTDMAFNLGVTGLLKFHEFLGFMQAHNFEWAADDLNTTLWARQVPNRARRVQALIRGETK